MRLQVYKCDQCKKEMGNKKHISLVCGQYSGIAMPPKTDKDYWKVVNSLQAQFLHFCGVKCIAGFFRDLIKTAK